MKKVLSVIVVLCCVLHTNFAQTSFCHGAGLGYSTTTNFEYGSPLLHYAPRFNFMELGSDNVTLAIGTHFGAGAYISGNSRTGGSGAIGLDFPVTVSANFGHFATRDSDGSFGGFAGLGGAYNYLNVGDGGISGYGPVAEAGLRAYILGRSYTVRAAYMLNLKEIGPDVVTLSLIYNFGID